MRICLKNIHAIWNDGVLDFFEERRSKKKPIEEEEEEQKQWDE